MEDEFQRTVELFDEYAVMLNHHNMDVQLHGKNRTFQHFLEKMVHAGKRKSKDGLNKDIEMVRNQMIS